MRVFAIAALSAACFLLSAIAAAAPPLADCKHPFFGKQWAGSDKGFDCTEIASQSVQTSGGEIIIRAIRDKTTDPQIVAQQAQLSIEATAESFALYDKLGLGFKFQNVTLIMIDPVLAMTIPWRKKANEILADANGYTFATDCIVRVAVGNIENDSSDDVLLNYRNTLAHELMHCVQNWTWPEAAKLYGEGAEWWMEGTAEFFSQLVYETPGRSQLFGEQFGKSWANDKPLTAMEYENIVFFAWLWQQGPNAMLDFFATLATWKGAGPQQDALRTAFSDETLTKFVRDYMDSKVALPSGSVVFKAWPGQPYLVDGDDTISFERQAFQIERKSILLTNGVYNIIATGQLDWSKRPIEGGEWTDIDPMETVDACEKPVTLVVARLRIDKLPSAITLVRNPAKTCKPCITYAQRDKCLAGKWALDGQAVIDMLNGWRDEDKMTEANFDSAAGKAFLVFQENGDMQIVFEDFRIGSSVTMDIDKGIGVSAAIVTSITGIDTAKWTTSGTDLAICPYQQNTEITVTVEVENGPSTFAKQAGVLQNAPFSYTCFGDTLALEYNGDTGGHQKPKWQLTRVQ
jgi:hypothetical protein